MNIKFFIGAGLLLALLAGCLWIGKGIESIEDPVSRQVDAAISNADGKNLKKAVAALEKAQSLWQTQKNTLAAFSNHGPMDDIEALLAETASYGANGLLEEFLAGCQQLKLLLRSIRDDHRLTWWNLLCGSYFSHCPPIG